MDGYVRHTGQYEGEATDNIVTGTRAEDTNIDGLRMVDSGGGRGALQATLESATIILEAIAFTTRGANGDHGAEEAACEGTSVGWALSVIVDVSSRKANCTRGWWRE